MGLGLSQAEIGPPTPPVESPHAAVDPTDGWHCKQQSDMCRIIFSIPRFDSRIDCIFFAYFLPGECRTRNLNLTCISDEKYMLDTNLDILCARKYTQIYIQIRLSTRKARKYELDYNLPSPPPGDGEDLALEYDLGIIASLPCAGEI